MYSEPYVSSVRFVPTLMYSKSFVSSIRFVPTLMYSKSFVSSIRFVPTLMYSKSFVSSIRFVPTLMYSKSFVSSIRFVPAVLYTQSYISSARCVPILVCISFGVSPILYILSRCIPSGLIPDATYPQLVVFPSWCVFIAIYPQLVVFHSWCVFIAIYPRPYLSSTPWAFVVVCILVGVSSAIYRLVGLVVKASASRAEGPGFESRLLRDFFGVESYQWLKNWHSSGYPARRLALYGQHWDWSARCQYTVTGWGRTFDLKLLSQCGST